MVREAVQIKLLQEALKQLKHQAKLGDYALIELQKAKKNLVLYKLLFQNTSEAIIITDAKSQIIEVNSAFEIITGYSKKEVMEQNPKLLHSQKHMPNFFKDMYHQLYETGFWQGEIWNRRKNGEIFPVWLKINAISDKKKNITHYFGLFSDITGRKLMEDQLVSYAYHDPLTNLENRMGCLEGLKRSLLTAHRENYTVAVFFMDLDNFKQINDKFGHRIGDFLLQAVAKSLSDCLREDDLIARLGGDEFVVVVKKTDYVQAKKLADRMILNLTKSIPIETHKCSVGVSIGISLYPEHGQNAEDLLRVADSAMYFSKKIGGNSVSFASKI